MTKKDSEEDRILKKLFDAVVSCDREAAILAAQEVIEKRLDPLKAIEDGLSKGAILVGEKFDRTEVFLSDLMMAADAMRAGLDVLLPKVPREALEKKGTIVIGTVRGDIHDLGKNIVIAILSAHGFDMHDLGADVPSSKFITEAQKAGADIIALSALMSSTIGGQKDMIDYLAATAKREDFWIMIGGGPTTQAWADEIGADGYGESATKAVELASVFVKRKR
jgi:corrinoid protein of di/trimethylamine methyltransferase